MKSIFDQVSFECSRHITHTYSTSFSQGIKSLHPSLRFPIYSIYGFVRFADEIVDTFHQYNKKELLEKFEQDYYDALRSGISLNPILHAFQITVNHFHIEDDLVQAFLYSMKLDLTKKEYNEKEIKEYIYGSADVVGLMCLKVFVQGDEILYQKLKPYAISLGSAFQKINFLRDLQHDMKGMDRVYFPSIQNQQLDEESKEKIYTDLMKDFTLALEGIKQLPFESRRGVFTAYLYYKALTKKIHDTPAEKIMTKRIRIHNFRKLILYLRAYITCKLSLF